MTSGVILFGIVAHLVLAPKANPAGGLAPLVPTLLAIALGLCAVSFLLLKRVPRSLSNESADSFWSRAAPAAQVTWAALEGAGLLSVVVYALTASRAAIVVALVAVVLLIVLKPAYFEGR